MGRAVDCCGVCVRCNILALIKIHGKTDLRKVPSRGETSVTSAKRAIARKLASVRGLRRKLAKIEVLDRVDKVVLSSTNVGRAGVRGLCE